MRKLVALELAKIKIKAILGSALLVCLLLTSWIVINLISGEIDSYQTAFINIGMYVRLTFIIFVSVLIAKIVIDEYRNKTISVVFTYPVSRQKVFIAKLSLISGLAFAFIVLANVFIAAVFVTINVTYHFIPEALVPSSLIEEGSRIVIFALGAVGTSVIPLFFGMLRKSTAATIVSSFVLALVNVNVFLYPRIYNSLLTTTILSLVWLGVGTFIMYLTVRNLETVDIN